jgi:thiol:disulfide interchange protein DsbC
MKKGYFILFLIVSAVGVWLTTSRAEGFGEATGACEGNCSACHNVTLAEAQAIVNSVNPEIQVLKVVDGPVRGLWEMAIMARGVKSLAYLDFAKEHIITGAVIEVESRENLTDRRLYQLSKADLSEVPLDRAILLGRADARTHVVVFDDPD